jgi:DNA-binding XRE family transcriptional regulator
VTSPHKLTDNAKWLLAHVGYQGDDCLIWPFLEHCDGYGAVRFEGKTHFAHRLMCELAHGKPEKGLVACHSCGNGGGGCVNPRHLAWKTQKENWADRKRHGVPTNSNRGRLTYAERMKIRELRETKTQAELAEMFGVARSTIGCIQRREPKKYRGVRKRGKRFAAQIIVDGKYVALGVFDTRDAAADAYQAKFAELLGRPSVIST